MKTYRPRLSTTILNHHIMALALVTISVLAFELELKAQEAGVPIVKNGITEVSRIGEKVEALSKNGELLAQRDVEAQLKRTNCVVSRLVKPSKSRQTGKQVWEKSRASFIRIGWYFLCPNCERRHTTLGGAVFVTRDGVAASAYHVIAVPQGMREGYLIAVTENGNVLPVLEILAGSELDDTALVRIKTPHDVPALALNPKSSPGDVAWCYSNPLERSSYFSGGFVTRFADINSNSDGLPMVRMGVSTEWAPGSSGAPVLDECGNVIGVVSSLEALTATTGAKEHFMTIHHAACAENVLRLITKRR